MYYDYQHFCIKPTEDELDRAYNKVLNKLFSPEMVEIIESKVRDELDRCFIIAQIEEHKADIEAYKGIIDKLIPETEMLSEFVKSPEAHIIEEVCNGNDSHLEILLDMIGCENRWGIEIHFDGINNEYFFDIEFSINNGVRFHYCTGDFEAKEELEQKLRVLNTTIESLKYSVDKVRELRQRLDALNKGD